MRIGKIKFDEKVPYGNIKECLDALANKGLGLISNGYSEFIINDPDYTNLGDKRR